ncbi:MAG: 30S ribosomal protein S12 methylthiotransferase RimO, partial [Cyanobacteria bacterium NC_groundwater_1444_Ag_S-0.65um_54_12]|nr:30S ribosomal protein S12 methylthiotransferase RimO [Cyanobacteria bacterium NC_groundwater_1444_Ag_S-0.65um_54_12]
LGLLTQAGYVLVSDERVADVIIVNTCSFIAEATKESIQTILELSKNRQAKVIVTGCLAQRHQQELLESMPEIAAVLGTGDFEHIVAVVQRVTAGERCNAVSRIIPGTPRTSVELPRLLTGIGPSAYLKISEGCDHSCAFCIIPQLRGHYVSREFAAILREARVMAEAGVKELVLIAEDTTRYGQDRTGKLQLPALLEALAEVPGIAWIRILYAYPNYLTDELLRTIHDVPQIVPYLDVPLQHTHPAILRLMRRPRHEPPDELLARLRALVPDMVIRTTFILGFPGEQEEHFEHLLDFVNSQRIDHIGTLPFSPEDGTLAAKLKPVVPKRVRSKRRNAVMQAQQAVSLALHQELIGHVMPFMVEAIDAKTGQALGRTWRDAPEIDGTTFVSSNNPLEAGDTLPIRIVRAEPYDLYGVAIE